MNTDWDVAIAFVLKQEGGYDNNPNDSGGETLFGVSRVNWPKWEGWATVDALRGTPGFPEILNTNDDLLAKAKLFYKANFWQPCQCDSLPTALAICLFDTAVNEGIKPAARILQMALEVNEDGVVGDDTIAAAHKAAPWRTKKFLAERLAAYARLMAEKKSQLVFAYDWSYRVVSLADLVLHSVPPEAA